jgi:hypothetical protein
MGARELLNQEFTSGIENQLVNDAEINVFTKYVLSGNYADGHVIPIDRVHQHVLIHRTHS